MQTYELYRACVPPCGSACPWVARGGEALDCLQGGSTMRHIFLVSLVLLHSLACTGSPRESRTLADLQAAKEATSTAWAAEWRAEQEATRESRPTSNKPLPYQVDSMVTSSIEANREVADSAITRQGKQVKLVLVVRSATSKSRAQQLGENFVRMYKSMSDDQGPGQSVGRGKYDYIIGVYYPNEKPVAIGAKASIADRISW